MPKTQPRKAKYIVDVGKLEEYIILHGLPPKKSSCTRNDGYWTMACRELLGKQKIDSRYVKAIANHYYCNLHGLKTRLLDRLQVT